MPGHHRMTFAHTLTMLHALLFSLALAAASADIQTHLNIGFRPGDSTVALNGQVAARYMPNSPNPPKIDQYFPWLEFFLTLTNNGFGPMPTQSFTASVVNSNATVETASIDPLTVDGQLTPTSDATVRVHMVCNATGQDLVTLRFDLAGYDPVLVQWIKLCLVNDTNTHGVFNIATHDWTHTIEEGDVVAKGVALPLWQGDDTKGAGNFILFPTNVSSQTFFVWMYRGVQPYAIVAEESDLDRVAVTVSPVSGVATRQTPGEWTSNFTVTFTCLGTGWFGFVSIELNVDPFDPVSFAFFKDCLQAPTPAPTPFPEGWSTAGVVFFTMFMFAACACVGGCVFKALKLNVRGLDVVPFIDEMRIVWHKLCGGAAPAPGGGSGTYQVFQSNVGPQAQFDQVPSSSSSSSSNPFGSSYQNL